MTHLKSATLILSLALLFSTSALAVTVEKTSDKGNRAELSLNTTSPMTCADGKAGEVFTSVFMVARENVLRSSGNRNAVKAVELFVSSFNTCDFNGFSAFGSTEVATYTQSKTTSAKVVATVALFDQFNGLPMGTAALNLSFVGGNNPQKNTNTNRSSSPGGTFTFRSTGMFNEATVTGTFDLNGTDLLASSQGTFAQLGTQTTGTSSIVRAK